MTSGAGARRGQPLWALGAILMAWVTMRAALFEGLPTMPDPHPGAPRLVRAEPRLAPPIPVAATPEQRAQYPVVSPRASTAQAKPTPPDNKIARPQLFEPKPPHPTLAPARLVAGHNLLWMAAMRGIPLNAELAQAFAQAGVPPAPTPRERDGGPAPSRWSGEAWLFWREGQARLGAAGPAVPLYGGSQAGALLRYALAPGSAVRPTAYLRAVAAPEWGERDYAAGLAFRPIDGVPVTAHFEGQLTARGDRQEVRPAAFATMGFDRLGIAPRLTARGYAQAGYVGGREATGFADGSLVAETPLAGGDASEASAGAGLWGGAQRGAARLDIGPTASLRLRLGEASARVSADYRLRIAGEAQPAASAAITLSAGF
jgi:hypothetical protein